MEVFGLWVCVFFSCVCHLRLSVLFLKMGEDYYIRHDDIRN